MSYTYRIKTKNVYRPYIRPSLWGYGGWILEDFEGVILEMVIQVSTQKSFARFFAPILHFLI